MGQGRCLSWSLCRCLRRRLRRCLSRGLCWSLSWSLCWYVDCGGIGGDVGVVGYFVCVGC